jgi:hypothetical protein
MNAPPMYIKLAQFLSMGVALSLLTTVAGINIFVLLLLPLGLLGWCYFAIDDADKQDVNLFFILIAALCLVDVASNINAGHGLLPSLIIYLEIYEHFFLSFFFGRCLRLPICLGVCFGH